ncbi:DUF1540 domain-containing protein [Bacillota bacterium LX-D]|nr:DUF1540 domain-containing protein [Bacillota bacterium LX-D]
MNKNENIGCTVTECKYHVDSANYCSLEQIKVVKNVSTADKVEQTDCGSFELK